MPEHVRRFLLLGLVWFHPKERAESTIKIEMKTKIFRLFFIFVLAAGCTLNSDAPEKAAGVSEAFYKKAINGYKSILAKNKDSVSVKMSLAKLYFEHGEYENAIKAISGVDTQEAQKLRAFCLFKSADYTEALSIFSRLGKIQDQQYLYYYGLTYQKQNLFEQALDIFSKIKDGEYEQRAKERINAIRGLVREHLRDFDDLPLVWQKGLKDKGVSIKQQDYPLAGAVVLLVNEKVDILPDNTLVSYTHFVVKILNERGKRDFSEIEIGYDSTYEKVEVEYAKTIKPSGEVVLVGEKDMRDVSRYLNFPLYSNARVRIISMPEITEGAIVEYKVKVVRSQLINKKDFDVAYSLQESEPILYAKFVINLPKKRSLKTKVLNEEYNIGNFNLKPVIKEDSNLKTYTWEFTGIPQIELESSMPPDAEINPIILISTFESWEDIYKWWWELSRERIMYDEAIKAKAEELTKDKDTPEDKIREIYNYCAQKIRYVGVEYGQAGYQPHKAQEIFKNKYGDCKDKAILFISMLNSIDLKGWPVLIGTRGMPLTQSDFPALIFNHCIAMVELNGKTVFLDITAEVCSFGDLPEADQGRNVMIFKDSGYQILEIPLLKPQDNKIEYKTNITVLDNESVSAKREVKTIGQFDQAQRYWLRYTPPNLIEEGLKEKIQDFVVSGRLIKYNYENGDDLNLPIRLAYSYEGKNLFKKAGRARILPALAGVDTSIVAKDKRRYPLELGHPNIEEAYFEIDFPREFNVKYLPENTDFTSRWMDYSVEYASGENRLEIRQKQMLKLREVSQSDYAEFKQLLEDLAIKLNQHVILERKNGPS